MSDPQTIREHQHAIIDDIAAWKDSDEDAYPMLARLVAHAVAALDLLDNAKIQLPMMVGTGMGEVEFIDDVYTPEGAAIYRAAKRHRLVPDPAPLEDVTTVGSTLANPTETAQELDTPDPAPRGDAEPSRALNPPFPATPGREFFPSD